MKFALIALIATTAAAGTADWQPCTKQDCSSSGWICCDVTDDADDGGKKSTGIMLCTDPNTKGVVPAAGGDNEGKTYHCTHEQHKEVIAGGGADGASTLFASCGAAAFSAYLLA